MRPSFPPWRWLATLAIVIGLLAGAEAAEPPAQALPERLLAAAPLSLLPADLAGSLEFNDHLNPPERRGSFKPLRWLDGQPVFEAHSPKPHANFHGLSVRWRSAAAVKKGDVILGRFYLRTLQARQESGEAEGVIFFGKPGEEARAAQTFSVGPEWTLIHMPFEAAWDAAPGEAVVTLAFAHLEQRFEIAALGFHNFGQRLRLADLPVTRFSYAGREPDAAWRRAALARIEKLRTAPLSVQVIDRQGRPVSGAKVELEQIRSAFRWGSEVNADRLTASGPDAERYRQAVRELFDATVIGNGLKWPRWRNPAARQRTLQALDWLLAEGKSVKGHNLAWTGWKFTPQEIAKDPAQRARIGDLVEAHIDDILAATGGKLIGWDVVNEPVNETDYYQHMPRERVARWFQQAEAADPGLELTVNEYAMLNRSTSPLFIERFREFVAMLRREGARVDVLGVQGHIGQTPRAPLAVLSDLDRLAAGGNRIQITEFDFNTPDEALQADYTRDFLIALYSHEAVTGFYMWGFWQGDQWKPLAAMYRQDWSEKPNLQIWKDWVLGAWRTRAQGLSAADGRFATVGHHGRYRIRAQHGGRSASMELNLSKQGTQAVLRIE